MYFIQLLAMQLKDRNSLQKQSNDPINVVMSFYMSPVIKDRLQAFTETKRKSYYLVEKIKASLFSKCKFVLRDGLQLRYLISVSCLQEGPALSNF